MSGLQRAMRHPDRLSDVHARARGLASDQLLAPLSVEEAAWLQEHLDGCPACRRAADGFASDRIRMRSLRADLPVPPRDLGARLSRALDVEVRRMVREDARSGRRSILGSPSAALAVIALAAVLVIVLLPLTLPGLRLGNGPVVAGPGGSSAPVATPMIVATQAVAWVQQQPDGSYVLSSTTVNQVCPGIDASACGTLDGNARPLVALNVRPSAVVLQQNGPSAVLVSSNAVYAFSVPFDTSVTPTPAPSSSIPTPGALSPTPAVTGVEATPPAATPVPTGSPSPRPSRTPRPTPATPAPAEPTPSATSATPGPTAVPSGEATATEPGSGGPTPGDLIASIPPASPAPSAAVTTPIIEGVVLVGPPPAYSTNGQWVAFSARPLDGLQGPDIYVWHVGDLKARPLTTDHASVFSAWDGDQIVGSAVLPAGSPTLESRAVTILPAPSPSPLSASPAPGSTAGDSSASGSPVPASPTGSTTSPAGSSVPPTLIAPPGTPEPLPSDLLDLATASPPPGATPSSATASRLPSVPVGSFLLDPATGTQTPITRPAIWRPVVDPTNRTVIFWTGQQALDPATNTWVPTSGQLVAADWQALLGPGDVAATPLSGSAGLSGVTSWDVRWDPSGRHLAIWIADPAEPSVGSLSLFAVNADGSIGATLLADVAALPGLSLGSDRLAWASPSGQNGQGSTLSVYAWSDDGAGSVHGAPDPGTGDLVVAR